MYLDAVAATYPAIKSHVLTEALLATGFSPAGYLENNADLQRIGLTTAQAVHHFLLHGFREFQRTVPVGEFEQGVQALRDLLPRQTPALDVALAILTYQLRQRAVTHPADQLDLNYACAAITRFGGTPFLLIGDSHSTLYNLPVSKDGTIYIPVHLLCTGGTALGLPNPHSKSGYGAKITAWLAGVQPNEIAAFFRFGQVDTEFAFIFHCVREDVQDIRFEDFVPFAERSVSRYQQFLEPIVSHLGRDSVRVCSIFPPVLSDAAWQAGYVNGHIGILEGDRSLEELAAAIRGLRVPNLRERTRMHGFYNGLLQTMAARLGVAFADDFAPMLDASCIIARRYLGDHDGTDHHLHGGPIKGLITDVVSRFGKVSAVAG